MALPDSIDAAMIPPIDMLPSDSSYTPTMMTAMLTNCCMNWAKLTVPDDRSLRRPPICARKRVARSHWPVSYTHLDVYKRQTHTVHPEGKLQAVRNLELLEDGLEVRLDGTLGDAEGIGNGDIAFAQCGVMGHFPLPLRQRTGPLCQPGTGQPAVCLLYTS